MVNVWDYANKLPYATVKTSNGLVFTGQVICVMDAEETYFEEDSLTIELESGEIVTLMQSEIESVTVEKRR